MWPTSAFLLFGSEVWFNFVPTTTEAGYEKFLQISKLPLGILASGLAAAAFIASIHRSIQTAKQIEETQVKNKADLYYAHLKFFIDHLKDNDVVNSAITLHQYLYPHLSISSFNTKKDSKQLEAISTFYLEAVHVIDQLENGASSKEALSSLSKLNAPEGLTTAFIKLKNHEINTKKIPALTIPIALSKEPLPDPHIEYFQEYFRKIESIYNLTRM